MAGGGTATGEPERTLSLSHGIALAVGSIAGSGILFLPSLTYKVGGSDVLLIWAAGTLLCLPMLFMFTDMVREVPEASGIQGFVARGLGPHVAASIPILFLALVAIGIPAGALVAGGYLSSAVGGGEATQLAGAVAIVGIAVATNLSGVRTGALVQSLTTWTTIVIALALIGLTLPEASGNFGVVRPQFAAIGPILSGVVLAFWAYAGFENLTFIAAEFRNPRRDFPLAMVIAFLAYGLLVVALTANVAAIIPRAQVEDVTGLFQLAEVISPAWASTGVITVFALALMQINANSWVWGVSRLTYAAARSGHLPAPLGTLDRRSLPRRAVALLAVLFLLVLALSLLVPDLIVQLLLSASSVFVLVYVLALVSYLRAYSGPVRRTVASAMLVLMAVTLAGAGRNALYPVAVFLAAITVSLARARRAGPPAPGAGQLVDAAADPEGGVRDSTA